MSSVTQTAISAALFGSSLFGFFLAYYLNKPGYTMGFMTTAAGGGIWLGIVTGVFNP